MAAGESDYAVLRSFTVSQVCSDQYGNHESQAAI